mgnify:CR=1 FL=1
MGLGVVGGGIGGGLTSISRRALAVETSRTRLSAFPTRRQLKKTPPPDPTSRNECTIGAAIACNASGARSFRYGPTRDWIDAVEVVLPNGEVIIADRSTAIPKSWPLPLWQEPEVKTAAGYYPATNLLDLMIGQEGTLGVVTKAWLRLLPAPQEVTGLICFFSSREMCIQFVEHAGSISAAAQLDLGDECREVGWRR